MIIDLRYADLTGDINNLGYPISPVSNKIILSEGDIILSKTGIIAIVKNTIPCTNCIYARRKTGISCVNNEEGNKIECLYVIPVSI